MNNIDHKDFEAVIGLKHAQLLTQNKAFAPVVRSRTTQYPNCPLCLGHPGPCH